MNTIKSRNQAIREKNIRIRNSNTKKLTRGIKQIDRDSYSIISDYLNQLTEQEDLEKHKRMNHTNIRHMGWMGI